MIETYELVYLMENSKPFLLMAECGPFDTPVNGKCLGSPSDIFHRVYKVAKSYTHEQLASYFNFSSEKFIRLVNSEILFPNDVVKIKLLVDLFLKYFSVKGIK